MSKLYDEDDDFLYLREYVHHDTDSYSDWELDSEGNQKYKFFVHESENSALYEIEVRYRIHKKTGEVIYDSFSA